MEFKTSKGTILPIDLLPQRRKNKKTGQWENMAPAPYMKVAWRIVWFTEERPDWTIETKLIEHTENHTLAECRILDKDGRLVANSFKRETIGDFNDHMEKACTGAIGRTLALLGFGTQFAIADLDEGDRLADAPVVVVNHGKDLVKNTPAEKPDIKVIQPTIKAEFVEQGVENKPSDPNKIASKVALVKMFNQLKAAGKTQKDIQDFMKKKWAIETTTLLTEGRVKELVNHFVGTPQ